MKNLKKIRYMQAGEKGIAYFSSHGDKTCIASLEWDGNILKDYWTNDSPYFPDYFVRTKVFDEPINIMWFAIFNLPLFILAGFLKSIKLFSIALLFTLFVSFRVFKILYIAYHMKVSKRLEQTSKFVSASHMATNAYNKLQRIPTIEEAKNFSRFSKHSTLSYTFASSLSHIFVFTILLITSTLSIWELIFLCLTPIAMILLSFAGGLNFLQALVTTKPSDKDLEVAIEGIKVFEENVF